MFYCLMTEPIKKLKRAGGFVALILTALVLAACEEEGESTCGGGSNSSTVANASSPATVDLTEN